MGCLQPLPEGLKETVRGGLTQDWKEGDAGVAWIREEDLKPPLQKNHASCTSHL